MDFFASSIKICSCNLIYSLKIKLKLYLYGSYGLFWLRQNKDDEKGESKQGFDIIKVNRRR